MNSFWDGMRTTARRIAELAPPTPRGLLVSLASVLALWPYGVGSLDLLLFVIGISGLFLVVLSALVCSGSAFYVYRRSTSQASDGRPSLECGSLLRTGFRLPSLRRVPLVQTSWTWEIPADVGVQPRLLGTSLWEEVVARHRALQDRITRCFRVQDAFGLCCVRWRSTESAPLEILPSAGRLKHAPLVPSLSGADGIPSPAGTPEGDRMEIRRYVPGDSARDILWARFAKTRQLIVRTPERAVDRSRRMVAYLVAGPDDEAAAAAARIALEQGALGHDWQFGADGTETAVTKLPAALRAIARSGNWSSDSAAECGLRRFLDTAVADRQAHCVVFAPARPGPWTRVVLELLRERRGGLSFVLGTDGIAHRRPGSRWARFWLIEPPDTGTPAEQLGSLVSTLTHAGGRVVVADRESGRYYGENQPLTLGATA